MKDDRPLAAAAERLRGKPGRPRKPKTPSSPEIRVRFTEAALASIAPRLLDLKGTAAYLGISDWSVRDLVTAGVLQRVRIPLAGNGELRKLLFDRADLDRLIEGWKEARP